MKKTETVFTAAFDVDGVIINPRTIELFKGSIKTEYGEEMLTRINLDERDQDFNQVSELWKVAIIEGLRPPNPDEDESEAMNLIECLADDVCEHLPVSKVEVLSGSARQTPEVDCASAVATMGKMPKVFHKDNFFSMRILSLFSSSFVLPVIKEAIITTFREEYPDGELANIEVSLAPDLVPDYLDREEISIRKYSSIYSKSDDKTRIFAMLASRFKSSGVIVYFEDRMDLLRSFMDPKNINSYPGVIGTEFISYSFVWDKAQKAMALGSAGSVCKALVGAESLSLWLQEFDPRMKPTSSVSIGATLRDIQAGYNIKAEDKDGADFSASASKGADDSVMRK